jgi:hypothetical protein
MTNPILNYAVSEKATGDAWGTMVVETVSNGAHRNVNEFDRLANGWEDEYKRDTDATSMPDAYRSAKSVLKNAIKAGVPLVNDDGTPKGKTAVEKAIKAAKDATAWWPDPPTKAQSLAETLIKYCQKHSLDVESIFTAAYNTLTEKE